MDWLSGMNGVLTHIEKNLTEAIAYEGLSKIVGVSTYEFSRIFSFMAGMSVSEYIRRRRLSRAVFDIQSGQEKIIDIALKYQYESPTTFSRAFKELHGTSPASARKSGVKLKIYPPISFTLQIKGVVPLDYRMEKRGDIRIVGMTGWMEAEDESGELASLWNAKLMTDYEPEHKLNEDEMDNLANHPNTTVVTDTKNKFYVRAVDKNNAEIPDITMTAAIAYESVEGRTKATIGIAEDDVKHKMENRFPDENVSEMIGKAIMERVQLAEVETIPAADWAVFTFVGERNAENMARGYARILTEWFPASGHTRRVDMPHLERFSIGGMLGEQTWEIWMPVAN